MKQNLINNIIQEMLHYLNNSQIMRLKQILEYHLFNYDLIQKVNNYEKNNNEDEMDFNKEMTKLSQELSELLKEEVDSTNKLIKIMEDLNYEIQL